VAGLATALWPSLILHTGLLHTETLAAFLLWLGITLLVRGTAGRTGLSAACLTRPTLLPMMPFLVAAVFASPPAATSRRRIAQALAFAAVLALPLASWNLAARVAGQEPIAGSAGARVFAHTTAAATDPRNLGWFPDSLEKPLLTPRTNPLYRVAAAGNLVFMHVWYSDNVWGQSFVLSPSGMNTVQRAGLLLGLAGVGLALLRWRTWAPILAAVIGLGLGSVKWIEPRPLLPLLPALLALAGLFASTLVAAVRRRPRGAIPLLPMAAGASIAATWLVQGPLRLGGLLAFLEPESLGAIGDLAVVGATLVAGVALFLLLRPGLGARRAAAAAAPPVLLFVPLFVCYATVGSDPRWRRFQIDLGQLLEPLSVEIQTPEPIPRGDLKSVAVLLDLSSPTSPPRIDLAVNGVPVARDRALWHRLLSCRPRPARGHPFGALEGGGDPASPTCAVYETLSGFQGRSMGSWPQWWLVHLDADQLADRSVVRLSFGPGVWRGREAVSLGGVFTAPDAPCLAGPAIDWRRTSIYRYEVLADWRLWDEVRRSSARYAVSLGRSETAGRYLARRLEDGSARLGVHLVAHLRDGRTLLL